jgi:excisionase family DNA binding protein
MNTPDILTLTIHDACKALGVGRTNLYRLISEGHIEARALGGRTVVPVDSLRAFVSRLPPAPIRARRRVVDVGSAKSKPTRSIPRAVRDDRRQGTLLPPDLKSGNETGS